MSSFVGHGLAALTAHLAVRKPDTSLLPRSMSQWLWLLWLVAIAWFPDLDHWLMFLHPSTHEGLRITHSLLFCQLLPALSLVFLWGQGIRGPKLFNLGLQASLAGFSQILLDLFVGIGALPLLWPVSSVKVKFWGLLPSAGAIDLYNYYFYRNLMIEMGVLLPLSFCVGWWRRRSRRRLSRQVRLTAWALQIAPLGVAIAISLYFMRWSASLSR